MKVTIDIKEFFKDFLKTYGLTFSFHVNLKAKHESLDNFLFWVNKYKIEYKHLIEIAFVFEDTEEGEEFWKFNNKRWKDHLNSLEAE